MHSIHIFSPVLIAVHFTLRQCHFFTIMLSLSLPSGCVINSSTWVSRLGDLTAGRFKGCIRERGFYLRFLFNSSLQKTNLGMIYSSCSWHWSPWQDLYTSWLYEMARANDGPCSLHGKLYILTRNKVWSHNPSSSKLVQSLTTRDLKVS